MTRSNLIYLGFINLLFISAFSAHAQVYPNQPSSSGSYKQMRVHSAAHQKEEIVFDEVKEVKVGTTKHPLMQDEHYKCLNYERAKRKKFKVGHPVESRSFQSRSSIPSSNSKGMQITKVVKKKIQEEYKIQRDSVALRSSY